MRRFCAELRGGGKRRKYAYLNHLAYGFGKTVSYAAMGAVFGFVGGMISFTIGLCNIRKYLPVKWIIHVKELSPCNKRIVIPSWNRQLDLVEGLQIVELMPKQAGTIS